MALVLVTAASGFLVTPDEATAQIRVCADEELSLVARVISAATVRCENFCERAFLPQTWRLSLDCFPGADEPIRLPRPRLRSITSVAYRDTDSDEQTLHVSNDIDFNADEEPCEVVPTLYTSWPLTDESRGNVRITYSAGYPDGLIPEDLRDCVLRVVAFRFQNRGDHSPDIVIPPDVMEDLTPYRVMRYV